MSRTETPVRDAPVPARGPELGAGRELHFPEGFLWGAATSSHQVEGGNQYNDWWAEEQRGRLPFRSGEACRHYELYERDFDLAREGGHNAHRFSLEWSRVEPAPGELDEAALRHYAEVVAALKARGLEPITTLHHFTSPAWFAERGGWLRRDAPRLFGRYVERVAAALSDRVGLWITVNEPTVYVKKGFVTGEWPPFRRRAWIAGARALDNLCRAHRIAYGILHRHRADARVGLAHSAPHIQPCRPDRAGDRRVAATRDWLLNGLVLHLIGARRLGDRVRRGPMPLDFLGINYYTRSVVHREGWGAGALIGRECHDHVARGRFSELGWEVFPDGLPAVLERFSGLGVPLLITENGVATNDESVRSEFLRAHLEAVGRALEGGLDVIGYLYWSLIDNYEWNHGTGPRFGLIAVDYDTQARVPRQAFRELALTCRSNRLRIGPAAEPVR